MVETKSLNTTSSMYIYFEAVEIRVVHINKIETWAHLHWKLRYLLKCAPAAPACVNFNGYFNMYYGSIVNIKSGNYRLSNGIDVNQNINI